MALTDAQKADVRMYLGYSDSSRGGGPNALESAMDSLTDSAEAQVVSILGKLSTMETLLEGAQTRQKVLKAEEVMLAGDGEIKAHRSEGRRYTKRLSIILGIPAEADAFGGVGSSGPTGRG